MLRFYERVLDVSGVGFGRGEGIGVAESILYNVFFVSDRKMVFGEGIFELYKWFKVVIIGMLEC